LGLHPLFVDLPRSTLEANHGFQVADGRRRDMRQLLLTLREPGRFAQAAKAMVPYLWIELVLPGGSILLLFLFLKQLSKTEVKP
jgi:hypothetical protein